MSRPQEHPLRSPRRHLLRENFAFCLFATLAGHALLFAALFWLTQNTRLFQSPAAVRSGASLIADALEARVAHVRWTDASLNASSPAKHSLADQIPRSMLDPRNDPESEIALPAPGPATPPPSPAPKTTSPSPPPPPAPSPPPAPAKEPVPRPSAKTDLAARSPSPPSPNPVQTPPKLTPAPAPIRTPPVQPSVSSRPPLPAPEPARVRDPAPAQPPLVKPVPVQPDPGPIRPAIVAQPSPAPAIRPQPSTLPAQPAPVIRPSAIETQSGTATSSPTGMASIFKNATASSSSISSAGELADYHAHVKAAYVSRWQQPRVNNSLFQKLRVKTEIVIAKEGSVVSARIIQRSGHAELDRSVLLALSSIRLLQPLPSCLESSTYTIVLNFDL